MEKFYLQVPLREGEGGTLFSFAKRKKVGTVDRPEQKLKRAIFLKKMARFSFCEWARPNNNF